MLSRRGFLGAAVVRSGAVAGAGARRLTRALPRPAASGTSTTRCARCGAADHTMLDPACPAAPAVV